MAPLRFIFNIVKVLRFPLHFFGILQLRFSKSRKEYQQNATLCRFLPVILISLVLLVHNFVSRYWERENQLISLLNIEKRPLRSRTEIWSERLTSLYIFLTLIWSLVKKNQLFNLLNEAQMECKKLKCLLDEHFHLKCSWLIFFYGVLLLVFLSVFGANMLYFNWPKLTSEPGTITLTEVFQVSNFLMGLPRTMFVLIIVLHVLYHLINAGWLQSLRNLSGQGNLKIYQFQLRNVFSIQKRVNLLAGNYFKMSYMCYALIVGFRIAECLQLFHYDSNEFVQQHKSQEDLEDEAEWAGQENLISKEDPLMKPVLILLCHLALWILLLAAARTQQVEYFKVLEECWKYKLDKKDCEVKQFLAENSWKGYSLKHLDIFDIMILSGISVCDRQHKSVCFVTTTLGKKNSTYLNLNIVLGHFKLLSNLAISAGIVYFIQQTELRHLHKYLSQESK
ncbi:uncharacterized protein LOC108100127 [Drosophila ficusphila]|uniref:uncharacterized protein LOC108100127 n=1 Tax=Drosophila ficusphila TaxID=30025 RepID=UPI0007E88269|nr:uncharacterized protein LOC108100127 [Drosophila ficusphila]